MRVMVFFKAAGDNGKIEPATAEAFAAMDRFTEELVEAGVFVAAAGLKNSPEAKRVVATGSGTMVIDGPFAETKEMVVGFSIWQVKDMDEAVAWARRSPMSEPDELELRPFFEAADLAEFLTPEDLASPAPANAGDSASPDAHAPACLPRRPWPKRLGLEVRRRRGAL